MEAFDHTLISEVGETQYLLKEDTMSPPSLVDMSRRAFGSPNA